MFDLRNKRGAWLNQYAVPVLADFIVRARQVDYVIVKYGFGEYEKVLTAAGIPWLAEIYPYDNDPERYARLLAEQSNQPGCVGAVVNMESGSEDTVAHWDTDDGSRATAFINVFHDLSSQPLYASIDTRGNRPEQPYQEVLAARCEGVMPMVYPQEFQQETDDAFRSAITLLMGDKWHGKPIIITAQTYNGIAPASVERLVELGLVIADGVTAYTIGHATAEEWLAFVNKQASKPVPPAQESAREGLLALRVQWLETMSKLTVFGGVDEVAAFATAWKNLKPTE